MQGRSVGQLAADLYLEVKALAESLAAVSEMSDEEVAALIESPPPPLPSDQNAPLGS